MQSGKTCHMLHGSFAEINKIILKLLCFLYFLLTLIIRHFGCRYHRDKIELVSERGDYNLLNDTKNSKCEIFTMWRVFPDHITIFDFMNYFFPENE